MRLSQSRIVSPAKGQKRRKLTSSPVKRSGSEGERSRARTKHKKLDAICEKEFNRNRVGGDESVEGNVRREEVENVELDLRRSTRVRRAPVLLDASPSPKRRRVDKDGTSSSKKNGESVDGKKGSDKLSSCSNSGDLEDSGIWKLRLRSRVKNVGLALKEIDDSLTSKRRVSEECDGFVQESKLGSAELDDRKEGLEDAKSVILKSKRPSRTKGSVEPQSRDQEIGSSNSKEDGNERNVGETLSHMEGEVEDGNERNARQTLSHIEGEDISLLKSEMCDQIESVVADGSSTQLVEKEEINIGTFLPLGDRNCGSKDSEVINQTVELLKQSDFDTQGGSQATGMEAVELSINHPSDGGYPADENVCPKELKDKSLEDENIVTVEKSNRFVTDTLDKPRIREGRRCGLCGGRTDGKPPKKLSHDITESGNEAYGSSSASEEPNYDIWDGFGDEPGWLGRLLGPINDRFGIAGIWVHQHCAVWSPEVYFAGLGCLKNIRAALCRGRALKCSRCGRPGATIGCRVDRCPKTYHLPCARADGCIFDHLKFLIACTDHRHLFQPYGNHHVHQMKKIKARKMKLEMKKLSNDACRKDFEDEEKWLENCGEDEEFLKRESKRLHRDMLRIAPVYIGGSSESEKSYQGWESIAGLQDVIRCLKEVVILPLLYPEFFTTMGLTPPRGVLLHGYPGTGKTLVVRALIGSCARGDKRIAYFARKGADCLGKYVGDAERQLRLLFQVAEKSQPSIIFFDEIDGLAPCRTRQQDQTHNSVVSTLLALMDGLKSRGSVIVIGATNRPDVVDPALRRPGRFDREVYFPLPSTKDRAAILSLHTQSWPKPVTGSLLTWIARKTAGFAGADLQALCTQAAMIALKRNCALQELMSAAEKKVNGGLHLPLPSFVVEDRDWLDALACAPLPCSCREAGMDTRDIVTSPIQTHLIPCLLQALSHLLVSVYLDECLWLPPSLSRAAKLIKNVIIAALEKKKMPTHLWWSHLHSLVQEADVARDIEKNLSCAGLLIGASTFAGSNELTDNANVDSEKFESFKADCGGARTSLLRNVSYSSGKTSSFRILIAGSSRSGQKHLASCLLHGFVGNVEIHKVNLATISQEGRGDVVQGVTHMLLKCASVGSCIIYMPRIDLWAIERHHQIDEEEDDSCLEHHQVAEKENDSISTHHQVTEKENDSISTHHQVVERVASKSAEMREPEDADEKVSQAWTSFVELVDSMSLSASLMILATSEVPSQNLPSNIKKFFTSNVLDCNNSGPWEHTIPRFFVQIDGNFNRDMVIDSSALELSRDLVQQFVQFIHHKAHVGLTCRECKFCDKIESNTVAECHDTARGAEDGRIDKPAISDGIPSKVDVTCNGSQIHKCINDYGLLSSTLTKTGCKEDELILHSPQDSVVRVPPNNRTVKGKSNILLAISTFGYQILRYPHFAELCWATSKLKEGPCTDINGPWKGWPFNSCIVRPYNSQEKVPVAWSSSNSKSKENYGLVRGLIAVGLSAYSGIYSSLKEVSFEVRRVLELLVGQVNAKIQGGKDRYRFVHLLSQVAYLEDMVNSWAYKLQSLEMDSPISVANSRLTNVDFPDNCDKCTANLVGDDTLRPVGSYQSCHEAKMQNRSPPRFSSESVECIDLTKEVFHLGLPKSQMGCAFSEGPAQQMGIIGDSDPGVCLQGSSSAADLLVSEKTSNKQYSTNYSEQSKSENHVSLPVVGGDFGSLKQYNGFAESVLPSEDGACDLSNADNTISSSRKLNNKCVYFSMPENELRSEDGVHNPNVPNEDTDISLNSKISLSANSGVVCFYHCCSECLHTVHILIRNILIHQSKSNGSCWTVEDVHEVFASCSVNLLTAFRRSYVSESVSSSVKVSDKHLKHEKCGKLSEFLGAGSIQLKETSCQCKNSGNREIMPTECNSHAVIESDSGKMNPCTNSQFGLDLDFTFRDRVLVPANPDKGILFHCKIRNLCLCSLIEWISMIKQPLG